MNEELYNFLIDGNYFTHSIGKAWDLETTNKLISIIKLNGIYSKESLAKRGIIVEGMIKGNIRYTKPSYVSLFDPSGENIRKKLLSPKLISFYPISEYDIVFLVDSSILHHPKAKRNDFDFHEVNIKDFIPFDYIFGIIAPNDKLLEIYNILKEYGIDIPVYDIYGKEFIPRKDVR